MNDFFSALAEAAMAAQERTDKDRPLTPIQAEAMVATLKEVCDRYVAGCPFKVGDLVTPRKGYNMAFAGVPHIVVEVVQPIRPAFGDQPGAWGSSEWGARLDFRCAAPVSNQMVMFWGESWAYEPYVPPEEGASP